MKFRVQLDAFCGPFDLLLYLVRRQEVDVFDIPIATIADQYLDILVVIEQLDVDAVGDFLDVASRLMEIKARLMLPRQDEGEGEEQLEDPRQDLVRRLLEYKRYKEAAAGLEERARLWQMRFARRANDLEAPASGDPPQPIQEVELWDLVSAFARVIREKAVQTATKIRYDDTPVETHIERLADRLAEGGRTKLADLFEPGRHRSYLVGMFLALLELIRQGRAGVEQNELFGEIWVWAAEPAAAKAAVSEAGGAAA